VDITLIVVIAALVLIGLFLVVTYNRLVTLKQRVKEAWSDIDVQLKRRHDLIPNLVETVKGYAAHERQTLENVIRARQQAVDVRGLSPEQRAQAENMLTQALRQLFALAEQYPQLRAVESFTQLQEQLAATEDKIAFARRFYNGNVRDYNTALLTFPTNLLAGTFGFSSAQYFEIQDAAERAVPQVRFTT
jgi:LemA protein